jgi:hypothetical protein
MYWNFFYLFSFQLLQRLNSVHITLSESYKRNILRDFGAVLEHRLIRDLSEGKNGKLNGDNLDIQVNTNDIRMNNKNKDYHFFATNFAINRISIEKEPNVQKGPQSLKIMLGRLIREFIPGFEWTKKSLPDHIDHIYKKRRKRSQLYTCSICLSIMNAPMMDV